MQNTLVIIFFAGGALFFLYRLIKLSQLNRRIQASQAWPQTSGTVTEAHVRHTSSTSENGHRNQHYYGEVKYTYQVMGASYSGSFKKDKAFSSEKWAKQVVAAYPAGAAIPVRYNPEKPQEALTAEDQVRTSEVITNALLLAVMAVLMVFFVAFT